jgi:hypothetical protein
MHELDVQRKAKQRKLTIFLAIFAVCGIALFFLARQTTSTPFVVSWSFIGALFTFIVAVLVPFFSYYFFYQRRGARSQTAYQELSNRYPDPGHLLIKCVGIYLAVITVSGVFAAFLLVLIPPLLHYLVAIPNKQPVIYESTVLRSRHGQTFWIVFTDAQTSNSTIKIPANLSVIDKITSDLVLTPGQAYCLHGRTGFPGFAIDRITRNC